MFRNISFLVISMFFSILHGGAAKDKCGLESVFGRRQMDHLIVGGKNANPNAWPWQVAIFVMDEGGKEKFFCGGSVINRRFVLTAAHCVRETGPAIHKSKFVVKMGVHNLTNSPKVLNMHPSEIIVHEGYRIDNDPMSYDNDLALFRLPEDLKFGKLVQPICLPSHNVSNGKVCLLTGWGFTDEFMTKRTDILQEVYLPIVGRTECKKKYEGNYLIDITKNMFCAGLDDGGKDSCKGDSGGPLVCYENNKWEIQGIVSFGMDTCAGKNEPGVYTQVTNYLPWIAEHAF